MNEEESLAAAINEAIALCDYDAAWPAAFQLERQRLQALLPDAFIELQHIGSTAVPGMEAKPVIDILAGVSSMERADALVAPVCAIGYTTSAEFNASLKDRRWFMRWAQGRRTHHLHLVVHDSAAWHAHIRFRDALRSRPDVAARLCQVEARTRDAPRCGQRGLYRGEDRVRARGPRCCPGGRQRWWLTGVAH